MTDPLLSIIVPIYNVEEYLERCIQSILGQTFQDYEVLLIDDGSTDKCPQICDSFTDERIRVFHKENGGVSSARNVGLKNARGTFITFIDPDDMYGDDNTLTDSIHALKINPDIEIVQFPTYLLFDDNRTEILFAPASIVLRGKDIFKNWYRFYDVFNVFCCNKIYRKEILTDIFFPEGRIAEDVYFCAMLMEKAKCICTVTSGSYLYYQRPTSIMKSKKEKEKRWYDTIDYRSLVYELSTKHEELAVDRLAVFMDTFWGYMECRASYPKKNYSAIRKRLFSYDIKFNHIKDFSTINKNDRKVKHLWAFFLGNRVYEFLYISYLRIQIMRSKIIPFSFDLNNT